MSLALNLWAFYLFIDFSNAAGMKKSLNYNKFLRWLINSIFFFKSLTAREIGNSFILCLVIIQLLRVNPILIVDTAIEFSNSH